MNLDVCLLTDNGAAHFIFSEARELTAKRMARETLGVFKRVYSSRDIDQFRETYKPKEVYKC